MLEVEIAELKLNYVSAVEVRQIFAEMFAEAERVLRGAFGKSLTKKLVGATEAEIRRRLSAAADKALTELHAGPASAA